MDPIYIDGRVKERGIVAGELNDHDHPCTKRRDPTARRATNRVDKTSTVCSTIAW